MSPRCRLSTANCVRLGGTIASASNAVIRRDARPWIVVARIWLQRAWTVPTSSEAPANVQLEQIPVTLPEAANRTVVTGIRAPKNDAQTIRPDANLLFVAGAGWTKKQADGKSHVDEAETLILDFLRASGASLGGSKSLVDQTGESQAVLRFMTHLNQVGQTGSIPRHPKGLVHVLPRRGTPCCGLALHQRAPCGESRPELRMGARKSRCALCGRCV